MKKDKIENKTLSSLKDNNEEVPDYPIYPPNEDIYRKYKKEKDLDPENETKKSKEIPGKQNELDFEEDTTGSDLDIPGAELDDEQENIGAEDEENNYYSLGGDDHENLDEDKGE
jgi:hypothetical protein